MPGNNQVIQAQFQEAIQKSSGFIIFAGVLLLMMGIFAMGSPLFAGVSLAMIIGIMLIIGGIAQLSFALTSGKSVSAFLVGVLTLAIGGYIVSRPGAALVSFTLFLALYLLVSGVSELIMSLQFRPLTGWGWAALSGVASMLLGIMIWSQFPLSGAWAIGILMGVRMFTSGLTLLMLGLAARQQ